MCIRDRIRTDKIDPDAPEFMKVETEVKNRLQKFLDIQGSQSVESFHRRLGKIMWEYCGMARNAEGLKKARTMIQDLRKEFYSDLFVPGTQEEFNPELEKAARVADFIELGELFAKDALTREESCGGHFREEYKTEDGEALRRDDEFTFVSAWEWTDVNSEPILHKEELEFKDIELKTRSYK